MKKTGVLIELKDMIEFASENAERIFRKTGEITAMYHAITADGEMLIIPAPGPDKDTGVALMKALFALRDVDRYIYIDEAWVLWATEGGPPIDVEKARREGVKNHPDRREILMFSAENRRGEMLTASRFILRPEHGKPSLAPLKIDPVFDHSEGRMVHLLNWEKR